MKTLNLDALSKAKRSVESAGHSYPCRAITARAVFIIDAAAAAENNSEKMRLYGDAIEALVPDMPRTEIDDMDTEQIAAVIELASTEVEAVKAAVADPNAESSAPATTTELLSAPT